MDKEIIARSEMEAEVSDDPEIEEDARRSREEADMPKLMEDWRKQAISEHLVYVKGTEIVFFEFTEVNQRESRNSVFL